MKQVKIIIPARYNSTRFIGKPLVDINGKPMIIRVVEIACETLGKENVFVATDDERISDVVEDNGYQYIMTTDCSTGTDRVDPNEATNKNIPKVVTNTKRDLIYMSRSPIPATKLGVSKNTYKQVCIYAFTKEELNKFYELEKTPLELDEDIEILRFLEMGINVKMVETFGTTQAVDIPQDVDKVLELL